MYHLSAHTDNGPITTEVETAEDVLAFIRAQNSAGVITVIPPHLALDQAFVAA